MVKNFERLQPNVQKRVLEIYQMQMVAFGGLISGHELSEVFIQDGMLCVRFKNNDWYHYDLDARTWF